MRKVLKDIREVAHYWANHVQSEGKASNLSFRDTTLYSWREPIAILLGDNRVLISNRRWSNSTSTHQYLARQAVHHMQRIYAPHVPHTLSDLARSHAENRRMWQHKLESLKEELSRHPRRHITISARVNHTLYEMTEYSQLFSLDWEEATADLGAFIEKMKETAEKQRLARLEKQKENLIKWRAGESVYVNFEIIALRIKGDEIETSRGASIPVEHARKVWPLLKRMHDSDSVYQSNGHTMHLGHYKMNSFNADHKGTLVVGCHTIPWPEIENMSKELGL